MSKRVILGQNMHMHNFVNMFATMLQLSLLPGICVQVQTKIEKNQLSYFSNLEIMSSNNSLFNKLSLDGAYPLQWDSTTLVRSRTVQNHSVTFQNGCKLI